MAEPIVAPVEPVVEPVTAPTSVVKADGSFTDNWHEKYGKENEAHLSRYKAFDDLVNSTVATKKKLGRDPDTLVEIPTEHSSDEVKAAFRKAKGVPDKTDSYEYTLSDELAVKLGPLEDKRMAAIREFGHKQEWSPKQFKDALDFYHNMLSDDIDAGNTSFSEQQTADAAAGKAELRKKAGWQSEEEYNAKVQRVQSIVDKYGGVDGVAELNLQNSPKMLVFLDNIAGSMSEDTLKGLGPSSGPTSANIQIQINEIYEEINKIMKENPANFKGNPKYKELIERKHELNKQKQMSK